MFTVSEMLEMLVPQLFFARATLSDIKKFLWISPGFYYELLLHIMCIKNFTSKILLDFYHVKIIEAVELALKEGFFTIYYYCKVVGSESYGSITIR